MKKFLFMLMLLIFIPSSKFRNNYDKYTEYWEIKKSGEIEILAIKNNRGNLNYKSYSIEKPAVNLAKGWENAENTMEIIENSNGTLTFKKGVLFPNYDKELTVVDEMMRYCLKDRKLYYLDEYNIKKRRVEPGIEGYVRLNKDKINKIEKNLEYNKLL